MRHIFTTTTPTTAASPTASRGLSVDAALCFSLSTRADPGRGCGLSQLSLKKIPVQIDLQGPRNENFPADLWTATTALAATAAPVSPQGSIVVAAFFFLFLPRLELRRAQTLYQLTSA